MALSAHKFRKKVVERGRDEVFTLGIKIERSRVLYFTCTRIVGL